MSDPSPLEERPDVPTRVLLCRDGRLFPAESSAASRGSDSASRQMRSTADTPQPSAVRRSWRTA
jgi:hypothetical protein